MLHSFWGLGVEDFGFTVEEGVVFRVRVGRGGGGGGGGLARS